MMKLKMDWKGAMAFEAKMDGHSVRMDTGPKSGGNSSAPSPKQLVLAGIAGCTAMDIVHILKKMRLEIASFDMDAETSVTQGEPSVFDQVKLVYRLEGPLPAEKVREAVHLSQTKYCGVGAMIAETAQISYEIFLNGASIGTGEADFGT